MNDHNHQSGGAPAPAVQTGLAHTLGALMAATDAFKNVRAIILLALTFITAALISVAFGALAASTHTVSLAALGGLLAVAALFYGVNAVGIMMMREAQGRPLHAMVDAVLLSLFSSHRVLAVFLLECLIVLAAVLAVVLVLFLCKIPVLGPVLYTAVFPLAAIVLGVLGFSLFYVLLPLTGPAVWDGATVFEVIARLNLIARSRLVAVVLSQVVLFLITSFVAFVTFALIGLGVSMTAGISAGVLGADSAGGGMAGIMGALMGGGGGSGYAIAAGIGGGLLLAVAAVIPALIMTKGACIIYLDTTRDLDFAACEAQLGDGLAAVKRRGEEARERARQLAQPQAVPMPAGAGAPMSASSALVCPACSAAVQPDDAFCGNCAHKLH